MSAPHRQLHLNAFLMSTGHHEASWRLPQSHVTASIDLSHYVDLARAAERARFDSVFIADQAGIGYEPSRRPAGYLEPMTLMGALAATTSQIGLIATASTTYSDPYTLARQLASLDHMSGGRIGWNIVTTATKDAERNYGFSRMPDHDERYARAAEFIDVAQQLWRSWQPGAVIGDRDVGVWADEAQIRHIGHQGGFYRVEGPLNIPRSPQVDPLLVQAGSSEQGRDLAARSAEAVFTAHQTIEDARRFSADVKRRAAAAGRAPEEVLILPGLVPVVGGTESQARQKLEELNELIRPDYAVTQFAEALGMDPGEIELDAPLPAELPQKAAFWGTTSRYELILGLSRREGLTVRQIIRRLGPGRGHHTAVGTPEQVADVIQEWFLHGAADGFNVMPAALPQGLHDFADGVIPVLQERGIFRRDYEADTLRGLYGLPSRR